MCPFSSVHRTNCAILTVRSPHFLSIYCDFIEFNVANNETESKRNFTFFKMENSFFLNGKSLALEIQANFHVHTYISTVCMVPITSHALVVAQMGVEATIYRCVLFGKHSQVPLRQKTQSEDGRKTSTVLVDYGEPPYQYHGMVLRMPMNIILLS